jgi:hypothetical protein
VNALISKIRTALLVAVLLVVAVAVAGWDERDGPIDAALERAEIATVVLTYVDPDPDCCYVDARWQIGKNGMVNPDEDVHVTPFRASGPVMPGDRIMVEGVARRRVQLIDCAIEVGGVRIDVARTIWPGVRARCIGFAP